MRTIGRRVPNDSGFRQAWRAEAGASSQKLKDFAQKLGDAIAKLSDVLVLAGHATKETSIITMPTVAAVLGRACSYFANRIVKNEGQSEL